MLLESEYYTDTYGRRDNFLSRIETRTKIAFTVCALILNILIPSFGMSLCILIAVLVALLSIRIPVKLLALRLSFPLIIAGVLLLMQIFLYGHTPLFHIHVAG